MIRCETPNQLWTVEGEIEVVHEGASDLAKTHVGIVDLSRLLVQYAGCRAKVRVEIIEGANPDHRRRRAESKVVDELKRMRFLATEVRDRIVTIRLRRDGYRAALEEQCIETLADAVLAICDQIEELDRRLRSLDGGK
jgi:hypothetical protein